MLALTLQLADKKHTKAAYLPIIKPVTETMTGFVWLVVVSSQMGYPSGLFAIPVLSSLHFAGSDS